MHSMTYWIFPFGEKAAGESPRAMEKLTGQGSPGRAVCALGPITVCIIARTTNGKKYSG